MQTTATAASARVSLATVCRWDAFRAREAPKRVLGIVRSRVSVRARLRTGREARDCVCAAEAPWPPRTSETVKGRERFKKARCFEKRYEFLVFHFPKSDILPRGAGKN